MTEQGEEQHLFEHPSIKNKRNQTRLCVATTLILMLPFVLQVLCTLVSEMWSRSGSQLLPDGECREFLK